jgi:glycosyltransferase involved in cell wall biosynthesis
VDEPSDKNAIAAAAGADVLFSVTREIIEKYKDFQIPAEFINHGISEEFMGNHFIRPAKGQPINVGLSGNFLRPDLDRQIIIQIIRGNPECRFHFFGIYMAADSNIGSSEDAGTQAFIDRLQDFANVEFHGVLKTKELAAALNRMDALFICYDMQLDQSKGTNYHKVMEYLSTGKVIISNNITTYQAYPDLIRMNGSRDDNKLLPALFRETITNLFHWNSDLFMSQRKSFANENTYRNQIERIGNFIQGTITTRHP